MADNTPPSSPISIGRFRIDAVLGRGGMGEVFRAFDPTLQRPVAVKTVRPDLDTPDALSRLYREAQALARLRHPNVVTVYEAGEIDGIVFMVMELLEGEDLAAVLRRRGLSFAERLRLLMSVLDALDHAHALDVVHRDIKPSNIYRQADGSIKIVDFGLARVAAADTLTATGMVMGTPHYASPEQLRGEALDHRTDIYSTGVLAYELIAGRRPFESDGASVTAVMLKVLSEQPAPMGGSWARALPAVESIVLRAMSKSPADRYQTAAEMRRALAEFLSASDAAISTMERNLAVLDAKAALESTRMAVPADEAARPRVDTPPVAPTSLVASPAAAAHARQPTRWLWPTLAGAFVLTALAFVPRYFSGTPAGTNANATVTSAPPAPSSVTSAPPEQPSGSTAVVRSGRAVQSASMDAASQSAPSIAAPEPASQTVPPPTPPGEERATMGAKELFATAGGALTPSTGLHYRITRQFPDGTEIDVDPSTTAFHSGDRIRLAFESNIDGHLYVVQQGSSGRWSVLFPSPDINGGRNAIRRGEEHRIPEDEWFQFDDTPGTEQVFVFLSPEPLSQLPGFDRPLTAPQTVLASVVENLRGRVQSRDLLLAKDRRPAPAGGQNLTTYVVNRSDVTKAVTASITLTHGQ